MPNSLIFVVILAVWAAYLIQHWIRRRDHVATARSVDRFSEAMRVLERRQSMPRADISTPKQRSYSLSLTRPAHPDVVVKRARRGAAAAPQRGAAKRLRQRPSAATLRAIALLTGVLALVVGISVSALGVTSWWGALGGAAALLLAVTFVRFSVESTRRRVTSSVRFDDHRAASGPARAGTARPAARRPGAPARGRDNHAVRPADRRSAPRRRAVAAAAPAGPGALTRTAPTAETSDSVGRQAVSVSAPMTELYDVEAAESPAQATGGAPAVAAQTVAVETAVGASASAALTTEAEPGTWAPVPVPPPTYTLKARAPRRAEPRSEEAVPGQSQRPVEELPFDGHALALDEEFEDLPPVHSAG